MTGNVHSHHQKEADKKDEKTIESDAYVSVCTIKTSGWSGLQISLYGGSSIPTRSIYAPTEAAIEKVLQGGIIYALMDYYYVLSVIQTMLLMLIPNN